MKTSLRILALATVTFGAIAYAADCVKIADRITKLVAEDSATILELVEQEVSANPDCACDVVKAAIKASEAEAKLVAAIVETAGAVAPEQIRMISQCAVAVAPDALPEIQAVISKMDPNTGEAVVNSGKSGKDAKAPVIPPAGAWNPLDFPGSGADQIGVGSGEPGGGKVGPNPGTPFENSLPPSWGFDPSSPSVPPLTPNPPVPPVTPGEFGP